MAKFRPMNSLKNAFQSRSQFKILKPSFFFFFKTTSKNDQIEVVGHQFLNALYSDTFDEFMPVRRIESKDKRRILLIDWVGFPAVATVFVGFFFC